MGKKKTVDGSMTVSFGEGIPMHLCRHKVQLIQE